MLVSFERGACQLRMRVVPGADHHQVHVFIVKHLISARHCLRESEPPADVMSRDTRGSCDGAKLDSFGLEVWQQHRRYIPARSNHAQDNPLLRLSQWSCGAQRDFTYDLRLRIVIEYDAQIRLLNVAGNQLVCAFRFSDWKPVCCQSLDIDPFAGDEFEEALDVSFLGPTHVRQRIIVTSFFIL